MCRVTRNDRKRKGEIFCLRIDSQIIIARSHCNCNTVSLYLATLEIQLFTILISSDVTICVFSCHELAINTSQIARDRPLPRTDIWLPAGTPPRSPR
jgi:hypothetical protein